MGSTYTIFMFVLLFVMMYFFMIRPQRKQQQQHQEMMNNLKKGDEVVTIGRLHGVIDSINTEDKTVTLDCDGVYLVFDINAIGRVLSPATTIKTEEKAVVDENKEATTEEENSTEEKSEDVKSTEEK
ncbi:preprotein translocase subunit YajC [Ligilactobacillus sp. MP3]|uniref:preprotein translocase subunit YajC n=1 Tax=Ligilactobacillus sp. MP3 TaxID=2965103 RepID=UPI00210DE14C|nr:preprotein translocase subunit YajC [Ligilactobacillus sp. MP3]MCQ4115917.1 preprotein translocase subunit YajC [Ligilactobacillus sp. MP3]